MSLTKSEREDFEERAAILEYEGRMSRARAEFVAMEIILKKRHTDTSTTSKESRHGNPGGEF